ncbi:IS3 family transposase [Micromonospora chersina]|uniref:IS3 family transposase n=1 Tax=Micromonospora chersina TaxID=47854 RepID=UPI003D94BF45
MSSSDCNSSSMARTPGRTCSPSGSQSPAHLRRRTLSPTTLIHAELHARGRRHGRKRIARLMRCARVRGRTPRRWTTTTIADPAAAARADLIRRDVTADAAKVNARWCGDITYIKTWEGWLYLATVIDIASRRVIGWSTADHAAGGVIGWATADHLRTDLVDQALRNAVTRRRPAHGVVFHSDGGCQYSSSQYARLAQRLGVRLSVGRTGQCWDNALAESFFAALKRELINTRAWPTRATTHRAIFEYIESWYNLCWRHSALDYLSPADYETNHQQLTQVA